MPDCAIFAADVLLPGDLVFQKCSGGNNRLSYLSGVGGGNFLIKKSAVHEVSRLHRDCISFVVPQATEWQRIGNQIDAAFVFAGADFVNVHEGFSRH